MTQQHIGNMKTTPPSMTEKEHLRKKVQIWWVKNDTAAYRKYQNDSSIYDRKRTYLRKKVQIWWVKMTQQHIGNLK
jgi:hypothetical protein